MDSHVSWLRSRIISSVVTQSATTFAIAAVVVFLLLQLATGLGALVSLPIAIILGLLIAAARVVYAMQNNPLNYRFMRQAIDRPFGYRVARFEGDDVAHPAAQDLPGFDPIATIRNSETEPEVVIDVYHDPSRLVAATINRSSGAIGLVSSLAGGRILLTDSRPQPPHERLVMNIATPGKVQATIDAHHVALAARADVVSLEESAHQVVLESLAVEHESYVGLGPTVAPFLDLSRSKSSPLRLVAKIDRGELARLPIELGTDDPSLMAPKATTTVPVTTIMMGDEEAVEGIADEDVATHTNDAEAQGHVVDSEVDEPDVTVPEVHAPQIAVPEVVAPVIAPVDIAPVGQPGLLPQRDPAAGSLAAYAPVIADANEVSLPEVPADALAAQETLTAPSAELVELLAAQPERDTEQVSTAELFDPADTLDAPGLPVRSRSEEPSAVTPSMPEIVPAAAVVELVDSLDELEPLPEPAVAERDVTEPIDAEIVAADEVEPTDEPTVEPLIVEPLVELDAAGLPVRARAAEPALDAPAMPEIVPANTVALPTYEPGLEALTVPAPAAPIHPVSTSPAQPVEAVAAVVEAPVTAVVASHSGVETSAAPAAFATPATLLESSPAVEAVVAEDGAVATMPLVVAPDVDPAVYVPEAATLAETVGAAPDTAAGLESLPAYATEAPVTPVALPVDTAPVEAPVAATPAAPAAPVEPASAAPAAGPEGLVFDSLPAFMTEAPAAPIDIEPLPSAPSAKPRLSVAMRNNVPPAPEPAPEPARAPARSKRSRRRGR